MTIEELIDYFKEVSLKHKDVKDFLVGSYYDIAANTDDNYPLVFFEFPFQVTYNNNLDRPVDEVVFTFDVFLPSKIDSVKDDYVAISESKTIGDAIITYILNENKVGLKLTSINSISVREYSDDSVAGFRYDITALLVRDVCAPELNLYFDNE